MKGHFTQADHGRQTRLKQIGKGDLIAFYPPRTQFKGGEPLQAFTAVGRVVDDEPYQRRGAAHLVVLPATDRAINVAEARADGPPQGAGRRVPVADRVSLDRRPQ